MQKFKISRSFPSCSSSGFWECSGKMGLPFRPLLWEWSISLVLLRCHDLSDLRSYSQELAWFISTLENFKASSCLRIQKASMRPVSLKVTIFLINDSTNHTSQSMPFITHLNFMLCHLVFDWTWKCLVGHKEHYTCHNVGMGFVLLP